MYNAQQIKAGMEVIDSEGRHIGIVDHVDKDAVGLAREGFSDNLHHFVPLAAVLKIDGRKLVVEPGHATTIEAVEGAILYARRRSPAQPPIFGTSGHGTGSGGSGF
ncbi:DUF2171 domain-containing protein [Parasphingorhabdus sp.]|uniref:DUF2171 domain-containing protein n=1 Tax=Parasphingorhabdus sp. TaxID=2709688 RepID=UPI003A92AE35